MRARPFVVAALLLGACTSLPTPTNMPSVPATPDPSPASSSSQQPTPSPTAAPPSPEPTPRYVPPTRATSLRVDGLARVAVDRLRRVVDPDNPTAHPRQDRGFDVLVNGDAVLLTDGPRTIDGRDFWQVYDSLHPWQPLGWVPAERAGVPALTPFQPDCPPTLPTTAAELAELVGFSGFTCLGSRELVLRGRVRCYEVIADGVVGSPFFDPHRSCTLDRVHVQGKPIFDLLPDESGAPHFQIEGDYEVRGQFDHPDSRQCTWIAFGSDVDSTSNHPESGAVAFCRLMFVVTAVEEL